MAEVDFMMTQLEKWSKGDKPTVDESARLAALKLPLKATPVVVDIPKFMGKWHVLANIPLSVEVGASNCVENYSWNTQSESIDVLFEYTSVGAEPTAPKAISEMHAKINNSPVNSFWALNPKVFGVYLPLGLSYLVLDVAEDGSYTLIGTPSRQNLWIMTRRKPTIKEGGPYKKNNTTSTEKGVITPSTLAVDSSLPCVDAVREIFEMDRAMEESIMRRALAKAKELGYDEDKVLSVKWSV